MGIRNTFKVKRKVEKTMNKSFLAAALCASCITGLAETWRGLDESNHYSGPKLTENYLEGKVVLVDCWGVNCPPCRALLPRIEQIWQSFKHKPFVLVGSHCQARSVDRVAELVKENKLSYPMYQNFGLAQGEPSFNAIPFLYVVNHRGKVVFFGRDERAATEAVVNALAAIDAPPSILGDVVLAKYKALEKQLVLGKNIKNHLKKLEADIKKAESKSASPMAKAMAEEAKEMLDAIKSAKTDVKDEIEYLKKKNPPKALAAIKAYMVTFPEEGAEYKEQIPEVTAAAKEFAAAQKAHKAAKK